MLPILLRAPQPAYADLPNERNTLNPRVQTLCGPPPGGKPFLVAFWGFLSWGPAFVLGVIWPAGALRPGPPARVGFGVSGACRGLCRETGPTYGFVTTCPPPIHPPLSRCSSAPGVQERVRNGFPEHVVPGVPVTPLGEIPTSKTALYVYLLEANSMATVPRPGSVAERG